MAKQKKIDDVDLAVGALGSGGSVSYTISKGKMGKVKIESGAPYKPDRYQYAAMNVSCVLQAFAKKDRTKVLAMAKKLLAALEE